MSTSSPVRKVHDIPIIVFPAKPKQLPMVDPGRLVPMVPITRPVREPVPLRVVQASPFGVEVRW